jgi:hypothetical protein
MLHVSVNVEKCVLKPSQVATLVDAGDAMQSTIARVGERAYAFTTATTSGYIGQSLDTVNDTSRVIVLDNMEKLLVLATFDPDVVTVAEMITELDKLSDELVELDY